MSRQYYLFAAFVIWLSASVAGMAVLWSYESRPGLVADTNPVWPVGSALSKQASKSTMLVWLHPKCPCSTATVRELDRLLTHLPTHVNCQVVLSRPANVDKDFIESDLTQAVRQLPVTVFVDHDQTEAKRFGVFTSGQVLMYGADTKLLYSGGITPGRGHEGDNDGSQRLRQIFRDGENCIVNSATRGNIASPNRCNVYGCSLFTPTERTQLAEHEQ